MRAYYRYSKYDDARISHCIDCRARLEYLKCPNLQFCTACRDEVHKYLGMCKKCGHLEIRYPMTTASWAEPQYYTYSTMSTVGSVKQNLRIM